VDPDVLIADLDGSQRRAVTEPAQPLAILAPAGSGKTRVLTRRIAWQSATEAIEPAHTLALTFTRKAAGELRSRLRRLGIRDDPTAGTFHAVALAQLRALHEHRGSHMPELLDRKARVLAPLVGAKRGADGQIAILEVAVRSSGRRRGSPAPPPTPRSRRAPGAPRSSPSNESPTCTAGTRRRSASAGSSTSTT